MNDRQWEAYQYNRVEAGDITLKTARQNNSEREKFKRTKRGKKAIIEANRRELASTKEYDYKRPLIDDRHKRYLHIFQIKLNPNQRIAGKYAYLVTSTNKAKMTDKEIYDTTEEIALSHYDVKNWDDIKLVRTIDQLAPKNERIMTQAQIEASG